MLALYRRYRPETFAEVIGQDHVTGPLQQALRNGRIHHAFLFSGPHGCGKTTSARILARALNCEQGPTPEPCGECASCVALARDGTGSLDVIEIDAASHGGVDDARDLRERAFFSPASSRFKIYIVDEAHMVTTQGFNALLKLVEEPPPHVKFVFATTEPEKVIGTIRSRTHHYPFRLVPPGTLSGYLADLCAREGIEVDPAVMPLVVMAGGGSVRDSLSVLDQLLAGAGPDGVTYAEATALLGYTDAQLLDGTIDALAAHDGAAAFELVDRVVEAGHDPRRFATDLLDRLRDLILVDAVPDAIDKGLIVGPPEVLPALPGQAARFGRAELVRAAEIVNVGLTEMRGATAPRLQLELICARVLLPAVDAAEVGLAARVDRLERRLAIGTPAPGTDARPQPAQPPAAASPTAAPRIAEPPPPTPEPPAAQPAASGPSTSGLDIVELRRLWPTVLDAVKARRRVTWMVLFEKVSVISVDDSELVLAFPDQGSLAGFTGGGHDEVLQAALLDSIGVTLRVQAVLDPGHAGSRSAGRSERVPATPAAPEVPPAPAEPAPPAPTATEPTDPVLAQADPAALAAAYRRAGDKDDLPAPDDPVIDEQSVEELVASELGAVVVERSSD